MTQKFRIGHNVVWPSGSGEATGKVEDYLTVATTVDGQTVDASEDDPRYLVKNDSTGKVTGHKPETLSAANQNEASDDRAANHESSNPEEDAGDRFQPGDQVTWNTAQGETVGTVVKKLTHARALKGIRLTPPRRSLNIWWKVTRLVSELLISPSPCQKRNTSSTNYSYTYKSASTSLSRRSLSGAERKICSPVSENWYKASTQDHPVSTTA